MDEHEVELREGGPKSSWLSSSVKASFCRDDFFEVFQRDDPGACGRIRWLSPVNVCRITLTMDRMLEKLVLIAQLIPRPASPSGWKKWLSRRALTGWGSKWYGSNPAARESPRITQNSTIQSTTCDPLSRPGQSSAKLTFDKTKDPHLQGI